MPTASKILERHVHKYLYNYFCDNNLLCDNQSGFRKNHSCSTCLTNIMEYCYDKINNGDIVGLVALDFRKAFDVMNHEILCAKLKMYGCNDVAVKFFKFYLDGRCQRVIISNITSDSSAIDHGVPQGSILGPLLFVIFINDLAVHCKYSSVFKYADDTSLCAHGKSLDDIQTSLSHDLLCIEKWCEVNKFAINISKSSAMIVCTSQKRKYLNMNNFQLHLYNAILPIVSHVKILGLYIDNNLTWRKHVDFICNNVSSLVGLFYRIRKFLNHESKILFYNSYILPRIDYCLTIWGQATKDALDKIFRLQKRVARIILYVPGDTSSLYVFTQLQWMSIFQRITYLQCILMYNIVNHLCPNYLSMYVKYRPVSIRNLRRNSQLLYNTVVLLSGTHYYLNSRKPQVIVFLKRNVSFLSSTNVHFMINISDFIMILF